ncbi:hypothetical protein JRQ81_003343 [Phrynocephalus forsythii]|uniref:Ig-like domain-containing protein n=1 Tax=Phrynocephalus forsythii TaxID=171643 RepID=A0A9Q0XKB6_9SAUR|nr:hypothetical protein JRQ81_003343 [Phrynocephalus forsythii]
MKLPRHPLAGSRAFLLLLLLAGAEQHVFEVSVWPASPVVAYGGSLGLNCSTSCQEAGAKGDLETSLMKAKKDNGTGWAHFQLMNITEWAPDVECSFSCYGEHKSVRANVLVYQIPEQVAWDPVPTMEAGKLYNLTCRVAKVAPLRNLTVTLRKGKEDLHVETFESHGALEATDVMVTHTIMAKKEDHGEETTCHAALDLRPDGHLFEKASLGKVLKVYDFPMDPQLHTLHYMEANSSTTVQCDVVEAFPAEEAQFDLTFGEEKLNFSISMLDDTMRAQFQLTPFSTGNHVLNCTVVLGPVTKSAVETVHVYSFREPSLLIHPSQTLANNPVTILCDSSAALPLGISVQIKTNSGRILASSDRLPLQFTLTAQEEYDGREFVCQVEMAIGGNTITKRSSANLTVFYVPEMDYSTCPSNHTWVEGTRKALRCRAKGNPKPTMTCSREGLLHHDLEKERQVTRSLAGVYNCTAVNEFGSSTRTVAIHVEYGPELGDYDCPSNQTWLEGTLQKLRCQAEGLPIPEVSCMKEGKVLDTRRVQNVTQSHAGVYLCNASNAHGSRRKMVTVRVEYKPDMDDSSCPYNWTWTVGAEQMFTCFAWGNPEPSVECIKDGISYSSPGVLHIVTRDYAGTYLCIAKNRHGSSTRTVSIQVEYKPEMDDSSCPSHWTLVEGAPFTFACKAEGLPPPEVVCTKDGTLYHISQGQGIPVDNGTYWCTATNSHGTVAKSVTVVVESKHSLWFGVTSHQILETNPLGGFV